ncbi:Multidrug resistance-associated protein 4 [Smittium culicis]|uniref:Multidrug resistance-associated protein 4 n=1 Tax=Smittium culicis TaxID=133412 RepID=A0A1R1YGG8_9FUNG|nr:Multidrug resistance-associated protein 4 [Smittium culicis]
MADKSKNKGISSDQRINGLAEASLWQKLTFGWSTNLIMNYGKYEGKITPEILPRLTEYDDSQYLSDQIYNEWEKQVSQGNPSLKRVFYSVFGRYYLVGGFVGLISSTFKVVQAGILGYFISYLRDPSRSASEGYLLALALSLSLLISSISQDYFMFYCTRSSYRVRVGMIGFLFRKTLEISSSSMVSTGQAINVISNDVQPFENGLTFLHNIWLGPYEIALAFIFIWLNIGISGLVAIGIYLLLIPIQKRVSTIFSKIRAKTVAFRDSRVKLLSDILGGIEIVKLNSWEIPLLNRVFEIRKKENNSLKNAATLRGLNQSLFNTSSQVVYFFTFTTLWFLVVKQTSPNPGNKGSFSPENIFPCVSLFSLSRNTIAQFIPKAFDAYGEILISIKRIEKMLLLPTFVPIGQTETQPEYSNPDFGSSTSEHPIIEMKNASFSWTGSSSKNLSDLGSKSIKNIDADASATILHDLTFKISKGELCGIVGLVGSGKSSLCQAILGEMQKLNGELNVRLYKKQENEKNNINHDTHSPAVAYASQSPWIFSGSIKDNILFGLSYNKDWFDKVVSACSLDRDFQLFDDRENTLIGERGATLSGGQRARVALARAVYTDADLFILDDPLSAVDPKVGKHLFDNVILDLLKDKTVLLVTHQLQFIHGCDSVVLLNDGKIEEFGAPDKITQLDKYKFDNITEQASDDNIDVYVDYETSHQDNDAYPLQDHFSISTNNNDSSKNRPDSRNSSQNIQNIDFNEKASLSLKKSAVATQDETIDNVPKDDYKIGAKEEMEKSSVSSKTYLKFLNFGAGYLYISLVLVLTVATQGLLIYSDYYLSVWSTLDPVAKANKSRVIQYFIIIFIACIFSTASCVMLYRMVLSSSNGMLLKMLECVIRAPISFFQSQPVGRIMNRFSKDQSNTDEILSQTAVDAMLIFIQVIGILVVLSIANKYLIIAIPFILAVFIWIRKIYISSNRQIKRIEGVTRSPVYSLMSEALDGMITIRSYSAQKKINKMFIDRQNENNRAFFAFLGSGRWLAIRLDALNSLFGALSVFLMVVLRKSISPGLAALSTSYILNVVRMVQWGIRQSTEVEITFISVERNIAYTEIKPEESDEISNSIDNVAESWPHEGKVDICGLNLRYPNAKSPVLTDITMSINSCEKIGVVGRTGAGKSSLVSSIFRLFEPYPNGCITVDGVNISNVKLARLRPSFSMIPQQPFLFEGTLRFNLDPRNEYDDASIWKALEASSLKRKIEGMELKLETPVVENGKNFSVGERQLVSLCRAILHNKKIVVMDEATANVDLETDKKIQRSIHDFFSNSTVITIAHRLNTVIGNGYDKIAVLDKGLLVEFGDPHELLSNRHSYLSKMVANSGKKVESDLRHLASRQYRQKKIV